MSKFSNTNKLNDMIDEFVNKYGSIFQDVVKDSMLNDIQKLIDEAKKDCDAKNDPLADDWLFEPTNGFLR